MPEALAWVAWASNDIERRTLDFIVICIASLHIARFRAGVASFEVRQINRECESWTVCVYTRLLSSGLWPLFGHHQILLVFEKEKVPPPPKQTSLSG
jgi:hypothetical protein